MNLERPLQLAVAFIAGLGTFMLGLSEEHYLLAFSAIIVSIAAFWLSDVYGWIRLNTWGANIGAIVALSLAVYQFSVHSAEARILALADLMGYLQFILQFKPKTVRNYWLIGVVSFLQVSVAAALNTGLMFALMLATYLVAGIFFLGLFYLYRESLRAHEASRPADGLVRFGLFPRTPQPVPKAMLGDFARRLAAVVLGTIALSAVFFVAVPRIGQANWVPTGLVVGRSVGFAPEMNLTRSGEIVEDPELVMQVRFYDAETNEPYQIDGEPYLRGTSVSNYSNGRWRSQNYLPSSGRPRSPPLGVNTNLVRQTALIEQMSSTTLFAAAPTFSDQEVESLKYNSYVGRLDRTEPYRTRRYSYEVLTTAFRHHRQLDLIPQMEDQPELLDAPLFGSLLRLPRNLGQSDPLARLKTIAAEVVVGIPPDDFYRRAKALEAFLRDSGRFQYTLDTPATPTGVDPLDEFVAVTRRGHCELFAGALAVMLRSVGVPARVVLGYRGGEYNIPGNFYLVRQLHAHSWVEAYLPPPSIPPSRLEGLRGGSDAAGDEANGLLKAVQRYGAWLQLDPTTTSSVINQASSDSRWGEVQQVLDYMRFLWANYVLGMDSEKQHESIYQPLRNRLSELAQDLTKLDGWKRRLSGLAHAINPLHWLPENTPLFSWRGGLLIAGLTAFAWSGWFAVRYALRRRRIRKARARKQHARHAPPPVDFYVQLEAALRRRKMTRTPEQTPREFVLAACGELAELPATRGVSNLPRIIVEAFYRVRFGGRTLSDAERADVEQALAQLNAAFEPARR